MIINRCIKIFNYYDFWGLRTIKFITYFLGVIIGFCTVNNYSSTSSVKGSNRKFHSYEAIWLFKDFKYKLTEKQHFTDGVKRKKQMSFRHEIDENCYLWKNIIECIPSMKVLETK